MSDVPAEVDQPVLDGLHEQLDSWRAELKGGARRVGWKIGLNVPEVQERLGLREAVIGYLTSATQLDSGGGYAGRDAVELKAEPEVAIEIGSDVPGDADADTAREAIAGLAAAIELVDVGRPPADAQSIIAANIFHRAFALGPSQPALPAEDVTAELSVNGEPRERASVPTDFSDVVMLVARLLEAAGERLRGGDRIIGGSLSPQVDVASGDTVTVDLARLGRVEVRVT